MQVNAIKVGELPDFVSGSIWQKLSPKPVTLLRAVSQFHNPRANANDLALIIAHENNQLLGLVGLLPDYIHGEPDLPVSSNTCWWADPEKGRQIALPLFLRAFALCNQRMFMTDCTPHTISILRKTNWFDFPEMHPGIRGFLKFNFQEVIPQKVPRLQLLKPLLKVADTLLNFSFLPFHYFCRVRFSERHLKTEFVSKMELELHQFITSHSASEFVRRSVIELEWILQFPWIRQKTGEKNENHVDYPFSHMVRSFEQYVLKISEGNKTVGVIMISIRDGYMKVPYAYMEKENAVKVLQVIYQQALQKNATTLTVFHPELAEEMQRGKHPFIFRKKIRRLVAISKTLTKLHQKYSRLQDGDGDMVFT
ncbi:MAG: hypothetical protein WC384_07185 [Prolixibacteraceae bacterium]|jgi:hypothetical protein